MFVISIMLLINTVISAPTIIVRYNAENNMELAEKLILNELESIKTSKSLLMDYIYAAITSILKPQTTPEPTPPEQVEV